ncbi:hypothetical protein PR048_001882 [Dryococelus australis]|uniref:HTH psq-type domain-containing protein n=1 Tax=Dryococelus australis TaxID=614101 RepID=A0ABQ9IIM1_9NEOP|nr:hypothetical protein PR048_001882 [Dryococelus australis]
MARTYKRKTTLQSWGSDNMSCAIKYVRTGMAVKTASKKFGVPIMTLKRQITVFNEEQEQELVSHILQMETRMYGLTTGDMSKLKFQFPERNGIVHPFNCEEGLAGEDWLLGFRRRHPEKSLRVPKSTSAARALAFNRLPIALSMSMKLLLVLFQVEIPQFWLTECNFVAAEITDQIELHLVDAPMPYLHVARSEIASTSHLQERIGVEIADQLKHNMLYIPTYTVGLCKDHPEVTYVPPSAFTNSPPRNIYPLPKIDGPTSTSITRRKRGVATILTSSPFKTMLVEEKEKMKKEEQKRTLKKHGPNKYQIVSEVNPNHSQSHEDSGEDEEDPQCICCTDAFLQSVTSGFNPEPGHFRIVARRERAGRCRWLASFLGDLLVSSAFHSGAAPYSRHSPPSALKTKLLRPHRSLHLLTTRKESAFAQIHEANKHREVVVRLFTIKNAYKEHVLIQLTAYHRLKKGADAISGKDARDVYLNVVFTVETKKRDNDKGDNTKRIKCAIAAMCKGLSAGPYISFAEIYMYVQAVAEETSFSPAGETGDPREITPISIWFDYKCENPRATSPGIEPGLPRREASSEQSNHCTTAVTV